MKTTANMGLKKPEGTDVVNIDDLNYNADIIDTEMAKKALKTDIPAAYIHPIGDGNLHVPATGTTNNGKVLTAGSTAGSETWVALPASLPANGGNSSTVGGLASSAFATSVQGTKADNALQTAQLGVTGGVAKQDDLTSHLADTITYSTTKTGLDSNSIYTEIDLKRKNGTLIMKSVLFGGTSPSYTTRTETYYAQDGTTVSSTITYTRTYDSNGNIASEVMN